MTAAKKTAPAKKTAAKKTQPAAKKAEAAAAREVDGQVLYVEYEEDYGGGYEVEMQLKDGSEAEVYLDKSFKVAGVEREEDEHGDKGYEMEGQSEDGAEDAGYGPVEQGAQDQK